MKRIFFLVLFITHSAFAQETPKADLSNPRTTVYTHIYNLQDDSYHPEVSAKTIYGKKENEAIDIAIKIKKVLDGRGLEIDFNRIPSDSTYSDAAGYESLNKFILFPEQMPLISVEKIGPSWYYSRETVERINGLYKDTFPWYIDKIHNLVPGIGYKKIFYIQVWKIVAFIILIVFAVAMFFVAKRLAFLILKKIIYRYTKSKSTDINSSLRKLAHPISLLISLWLISRILPSLQFSLEINKWLFLAINIATIVFWIYVFLKLAQVLISLYQGYADKTEGKLDNQLVPIVKNFSMLIIIIFGAFRLLVLFGADPATVLAGASIGGLAIAFASQDTVKNLIGTVMIFVDKPFHIGDWIEGGGVVGTVEEVGFRSTRIRASDTSVFQIPNSKLSEIVIKNSGLRLFRRYNTTLGLRYDTPPELIEAFVQGVREIILAHPDTKKDAYNVEFTAFGGSSLDIMVNMYFKTLAWGTVQNYKHQIHIAIIKLAVELGVDFAFPSTTMMIEQLPDKSIDIQYNTAKETTDKAIEKTVNEFKGNFLETEN